MPATSESPSDAAASSLSRVLQTNVPGKFSLSAKAAAGILARSQRRDRELPPMLKQALVALVEREGLDPTQVELTEEDVAEIEASGLLEETG